MRVQNTSTLYKLVFINTITEYCGSYDLALAEYEATLEHIINDPHEADPELDAQCLIGLWEQQGA